MAPALKPFLYVLPVALAGALAFGALAAPGQSPLDLLRAPCSRPLSYAIGAYDERFGISREAFAAHAAHAAALWNEAAGRTLIVESADPEVTVGLLYDERQRAVEVGEDIEDEQAEYQRLRAGVETLRSRYVAATEAYERTAAVFTRDADALEERVSYWNDRGGAPPDEYAELEAERRALEASERSLRTQVRNVNELGEELEARVDALNAFAARTNEKVEEYNAAVGDDFDQGNYVSDADGKRITIFEFENEAELARVLAHEFGHALGIGHTDDPDSVMYSYNLGTKLALTEADKAALAEACTR